MTGFQSKRQASKDLLEQALDALDAITDKVDGTGFNSSSEFDQCLDAIDAIRQHLAQPAYSLDTLDHMPFQGRPSRPEERAVPNPWRDAIDAALVCLHLGTADSFPDANEALNALISWHVATALDPTVSSDAQALVDRGAAMAESLSDDELRECFTSTNTSEPLTEGWPGLEPFGAVTYHTYGQPQFTAYPQPPYLDTAVSCESVYTADQMHDYAAAGYRAGLEAAAKEVSACAHGILADFLDVDSHRRVIAAEQRIRALEAK